MNSKDVQSCNLINTAANPNSDGVFVTVMQQLWQTDVCRGPNIFSFTLCCCKWDFYHLTKSWRSGPDRCCWRGEQLLHAITADVGIKQLSDKSHEFAPSQPTCSDLDEFHKSLILEPVSAWNDRFFWSPQITHITHILLQIQSKLQALRLRGGDTWLTSFSPSLAHWRGQNRGCQKTNSPAFLLLILTAKAQKFSTKRCQWHLKSHRALTLC